MESLKTVPLFPAVIADISELVATHHLTHGLFLLSCDIYSANILALAYGWLLNAAKTHNY